MAQQHPQRNPILLGHRLRPPIPIDAPQDPNGLELRTVPLHHIRIIQRQPSPLDQLHRRDAGNHLRARRDPEDRVDALGAAGVRKERGAVSVDDHGDAAGDLAGVGRGVVHAGPDAVLGRIGQCCRHFLVGVLGARLAPVTRGRLDVGWSIGGNLPLRRVADCDVQSSVQISAGQPPFGRRIASGRHGGYQDAFGHIRSEGVSRRLRWVSLLGLAEQASGGSVLHTRTKLRMPDECFRCGRFLR